MNRTIVLYRATLCPMGGKLWTGWWITRPYNPHWCRQLSPSVAGSTASGCARSQTSSSACCRFRVSLRLRFASGVRPGWLVRSYFRIRFELSAANPMCTCASTLSRQASLHVLLLLVPSAVPHHEHPRFPDTGRMISAALSPFVRLPSPSPADRRRRPPTGR